MSVPENRAVVGRADAINRRDSAMARVGPSRGLRGQAPHRTKVAHFCSATWPGFTPPLTIVHIGTTAHPTAAWVAQQIREAFPWETAPRYMIRDRDRVYGIAFRSRIKAMGIEEVVTAPRSPWQSPYVERVIGSIRRECLDHVIVLNQRHLRAILLSYIDYYQRSRTHLALGKDTPERRSVQPAGAGKIVAFPQVGGLHHRYQRLAA